MWFGCGTSYPIRQTSSRAGLCFAYFDTARPAATMMVVGLAESEMKIEIEVTALVADDHRSG